MCSCDAALMRDDVARFANQLVVELPENQTDKVRRMRDGLSIAVCVDPCILAEIKKLWENGIQTRGCCCGHNNPDWYPFVNVAEESIQAMFDMGYVQKHWDLSRKDTFILKSVKKEKL